MKTITNDSKIFIDMDGVLARFYDPSNFKPYDLKIRKPPRAYEKGFFENLPVINGASWAVRALIRERGVENIFILTAPLHKNIWCYSEKAAWIAKHFPELINNIIISGHKELCSGLNRILIDDHLDWEEKWEEKEGTFIHFDTKENILLEETKWEEIIRFLNPSFFFNPTL